MFGSAITDGDRQIDTILSQQLAAQGYDSAAIQSFSLSNPRIYNAVESLRHSMVKADALRSLLFLAAGGALLLLYFRRKLSAAPAVLACAALILADLYTVDKRYLDTQSFLPRQLAQEDPFPLTAAERTILTDTTANYRVMDIPRFWQAAPSYRHKAIGGYHAAKLTRYQDIIDTHLANFLSGTQTDADWNVLNMLNARYIIDPNRSALFNPEAFGNAWLVDSLTFADGPDAEMAALSLIPVRTAAVADKAFAATLAPPTPTSPGDTIFETSYAPNRLTYHTSAAAPALAVFSEVYFPWGWHATVDGTPVDIARVNYILRAINIPAGQHTVEMWFDPTSLKTTTTAATTAIIIIYLLALAGIATAILRYNGKKDETGSMA